LIGKRGATPLGFALLLKHYSRHGRFPRGRSDLHDGVIDFDGLTRALPGALGYRLARGLDKGN